MRRKVLIAAAALAVVGALYWSQLPQRVPVHETSPAGAAQPAGPDGSASSANSTDSPTPAGSASPAGADASPSAAEREALAAPPPLALPETEDGAAAQAAPASETRASAAPAARAYPDFLPKEAIATLRLIERGGPYPYRQDDGVFQNRERRLPPKPRGYYREYTVKTPGSPDRGARRIVAGGQPPVEFFYTDDHYRSFRRFTLVGGGTGR